MTGQLPQAKKPLVLCDVDGVAADFIGGVCKWIKSHGLLYHPEDFTDFELHKTIPYELVQEIGKEIGFCNSLEWYRGAFDFLATLREHTDLHFITAPWNAPTWEAERRHWLSRLVPASRVASVPSSMKHLMAGDWLIEDRLETCTAWIDAKHNQATGGGEAILIDRPWNQGPTGEGVHRVRSYDDALTVMGIK